LALVPRPAAPRAFARNDRALAAELGAIARAAPAAAWGTDLTVDDERTIVSRIAAGDRDALAELYGRYRRSLYAYLCLATPDRGLAEEILQDTFLAVWNAASGFRGRSSVRGWVYGIARRQAHNTLRRARLPLAGPAALDTLRCDEPEPEAIVLARATGEDLRRAIDRLSPPLRETLILIVVHELSYREAAEVLRVPVGTIRSRLNSARQALQPFLAPVEDTVR